MKTAACLLALCFVACAARASPVSYVPASGPPNVVGGERSGFWSEPADLNGLLASSEQILSFDLESEWANDFVLTDGHYVGVASWWGVYYNNPVPCYAGMTAQGFNLRFYEDAGCLPGATVADLSITSFQEESMGCEAQAYPIFKWTVYLSDIVTGDGVYWCGVQMKDHGFPPQFGRLASGGVVGCESVFKSAYFGYPDWTQATSVFGVAVDCSQEFDCMICSGSSGVDEPTATRATEKASWGRVKALYR